MGFPAVSVAGLVVLSVVLEVGWVVVGYQVVKAWVVVQCLLWPATRIKAEPNRWARSVVVVVVVVVAAAAATTLSRPDWTKSSVNAKRQPARKQSEWPRRNRRGEARRREEAVEVIEQGPLPSDRLPWPLPLAGPAAASAA